MTIPWILTTTLSAGAVLALVGALWRERRRRRAAEAKAAALEDEARAMVHSGSSQLQASRSRFRHLVEVTPLGIFEATAQGEFAFVSSRWQELTGLDARAAQGVGWLAAVREDERGRVARAWRRATAAGLAFELEWPLWEGGSVEWVHCQATPRSNPHDGTRAYIGTLTDVTERKRLEEERRRSDESQAQTRKLESLGVMAGGIAHDFNNLLVGVLGNTELLKADVPPGSEKEVLLTRLERAARRAADLAHQMLVFAGQGVVERGPLEISKVVAESLALFDEKARGRLHCRLEPGLPTVRADRTRLQQIATNLVCNALESSGDGLGVVDVRTELRCVSADELAAAQIESELEPGEVVVLEVADSGCGIEPGVLRRIFDPFYSTKFAGRGLGLGVVAGAVRANGAALLVHSAPGRGTRVRVFFELDGARAVDEVGIGASSGASVSGGHLLVVDDERLVRETIQAILERSGYRVDTAESGAAGLEILQREQGSLDAVLLDMTMPGMNGRETLRAMREVDRAIPVLLLSGHSEEDVKRAFTGDELAGFVLKPFTGATLLGSLERALR